MTNRTLGDLFSNEKNNFNFLRLVAAILVIYGHSNAIVFSGGSDFVTRHLNWGFTGGIAVDIFFVISGFLVTASAMKGNVSYYIKSRIFRIFPALVFWVGVSAFIIAPLFSDGNYNVSSSFDYFFNMASAYKIVYFIDGAFPNNRDQAINGSLWSIILEVRLYIVVIMVYLLGVFRSKTLFNFMFFAALVIFNFYPGEVPFSTSSTDVHVSTLFLIGAFYWVNRESILISPFIAFLFFAFMSLGLKAGHFETAYIFSMPYLVFCIVYMKGLGVFRRIGDYSYGIYLVGWPVQQVIVAIHPSISVEWHQFSSILVAFILGMFSWHFVEKPSLQLKNVRYITHVVNFTQKGIKFFHKNPSLKK